MTKTRLEAFSDGVIAIIITIMVLELKVPHGTSWNELEKIWPVIVSYIASFVSLGIYWGNHHHLIHTLKEVNGSILWANLHLLFWLSLVPFSTAWMGEHHGATAPSVVYGLVLLMAAIAYYVLVRAIISEQLGHSGGTHSRLKDAIGGDRKGQISIVLYAAGMALAFLNRWLADALYVAVALMWLVPDRRLARKLG